MSEPANEAPGMSPAGANEIRPRIWPAVTICVLYLCLFSVSFLTSTILWNAVGVLIAPALCGMLMAVWWLFFSNVPWKTRLAGAGIVATILVWIVLSQQSEQNQILILVIPVIIVGTVLTLVLTQGMPWRTRRLIALVVPVGCAVVFPLFRIAYISANLAPSLVWRWTPNSEDLVAASAAGKGSSTATMPTQVGPLDWPAFRGAGRDGVVSGVTFATNWKESKPKEVWRKPVGLGFSSFVAVGDYLFTMEQRLEDEAVVCYRADTGEEIWINRVAGRFVDSTGSGPRSTPAYDQGKLYCQGTFGLLQCLDASTGKTIWQKDIKEDTGAKVPEWGFASSPLVTDKLVMVFAGGPSGKGVVAYDKLSGELVWCRGRGTHGYSSVHLTSIAGVPQVIVLSDFGAQSLTPDRGEVLWENEWQTNMNTRVVQPVIVDGNAVLVGTAEEKGTRFLQIVKTESSWVAEEKWTTRSFRPYFNDYAQHKGFCYGFDGDLLMCIDAHTGAVRWKGSRYGGQVILVADIDTLVVLGQRGDLALVKAAPEKFEEIAKFKALKGKTWNHPIIAHGKLFVRNGEEAACFDLGATAANVKSAAAN